MPDEFPDQAELPNEESGANWHRRYAFEHAFGKLATALRWMFWGILLQLVGAALAIAPVAALLIGGAKLNPKLVLPGIIAMAVGGIVLLIGEQKCLHLELPLGMTRSLPGHGWLRTAYWCHLGSWLLRLARNFLDRGLVGLVLLPLQLVGFTFLLLFLRKTADVLARKDLKWMVDTIFATLAATIFSGAFLGFDVAQKAGMLKMLPRPIAMTLFASPLVFFLVAVGVYLVLLWRMSVCAASFAKYLADSEITPQAREMYRLSDELGWRFEQD